MVELTMPWGFEDAGKALQQVFKVFDGVAKRSSKVADAFHMRRRRNAARDLDYLRFGAGGSLPHIIRISKGNFNDSDFNAIQQSMDDTAVSVEVTIKRLNSYAHLVREKIGIDARILLEKIIEGDCGKEKVRKALRELVQKRNNRPAAKKCATEVMGHIRTLNEDIIELHNLLLKHKREQRKRKAAAKRAKSKKNTKGVKRKAKRARK